jgi:hypothetical protein
MTADERPGTRAHGLGIATASVCVAVAAGLWVLLVSSSLNLHDMEVGAACVAATVVFTGFVVRTAGMRFKLRLRDFLEGWRIPWYIACDAAVVLWVLIKDVLHVERAKNLFRVSGFDTSKHDPVRIARTVLAVAYATCSPNCIVIGIDQTQSRMLFHQLQRSGIPTMLKALGAKG